MSNKIDKIVSQFTKIKNKLSQAEEQFIDEIAEAQEAEDNAREKRKTADAERIRAIRVRNKIEEIIG